MKIAVRTGSAHRHGTTAALADRFQQGALDAGHEFYRFDAAFRRSIPHRLRQVPPRGVYLSRTT